MAKEDIIRKLTSRKLWIAVAALVSGLILAFGGKESTAQTVSGVILQAAAVLGYLLSEGLADAAGAAAGTGAADYTGRHQSATPTDSDKPPDETPATAEEIIGEWRRLGAELGK